MEKVILAFEREKSADRIREILETAGLGDCLICRSAAEVKRLVHKQRVTTVVCGYKLSDETAETLFDDLPSSCSMLVVEIQSMLNLMGNDEIFRLAAPVSRSDLVASVRMLLQMGHRMEKYVRPQRSAEEQAVIEQAKMILMDRHGMAEEQAHRFLQKKSMDSGAKLIQTAQMIIDGIWTL